VVSPAMCYSSTSRSSQAANLGRLAYSSVDNCMHRTYALRILRADEQCVCLSTKNMSPVLDVAVLVPPRYTPSEAALEPV
jgi:hypothetical protein